MALTAIWFNRYIKECYDWERMQYPREPLKKITSWIETMSLELPQPTNVIAPAAPAAGQAVEVVRDSHLLPSLHA